MGLPTEAAPWFQSCLLTSRRPRRVGGPLQLLPCSDPGAVALRERAALSTASTEPMASQSGNGSTSLANSGRTAIPQPGHIEALQATAAYLMTPGKGILAADETIPHPTKRCEALGIASNAEFRRSYREMLFTAPDLADYISGVILQDETIRQNSECGVSMAGLLAGRGILPGIKVDRGAKPLAGYPGETVTEGLDGLRERLAEYVKFGAKFAKWRAVIRIGDATPTLACISANAHALARYAALCQEQALLPIVEPEVLMEGAHDIGHCEMVTGAVLEAVFRALYEQGVTLEAVLLKPSMVIAGQDCAKPASVKQVAAATLRTLRRHVPAAVPGIVFLSGGQDERLATTHLNAISNLAGSRPWSISFSYGRALQDPALNAWRGRSENRTVGREALSFRARCNAAASLGTYNDTMEATAHFD